MLFNLLRNRNQLLAITIAARLQRSLSSQLANTLIRLRIGKRELQLN